MGLPVKNFVRPEFACNCGCGFDTVDAETLFIVQDVRDKFGRPVRVTSGCRCPEWNRRVGGAKNSKHLLGMAIDFIVPGVSPKVVADYIRKKYPKASVKEYMKKGFVHVDCRSGKPWRP